jgi:hypothetical protein
MDSNTTISDSPVTDSSVVTKGFTQIALGAAAGAFVAMRMNRAALLLSAGLAYALWKQQQGSAPLPEEMQQEPFPEVSAAPVAEPVQAPAAPWQAPAAPLQEPFEWATRPAVPEANLRPDSSLQPFFIPPVPPVQPLEEPAPSESAWDDLRAAITPAVIAANEEPLPAAVAEASEMQSAVLAEGALPEADESTTGPALMGMDLCLPSSPMVPHSMDETDVLPGDMLFIEQAQATENEEPAPSLFFAPDSELVATPQSLGITETLIVPKPITQPLVSGSNPKETSLAAPVMLPRDLQARKTFFDWLRG